MDWTSDEGTKTLWRISSRVLEALTEHSKPLELRAPEAFAVLMICIGRFAGSVGFRHVGLDGMWKHFTENRAFFKMGFDGERRHES